MTPYNGLLLVDKPRGLTSHDVVLALRRVLPRGVKVGHTGTLDPMANGLLLLVIGAATKAASYYQQLPKVYCGRIRLGIETATGDLDGKVLRETPIPELEVSALQSAVASFVGELEMPPPMYSAVKYKGKPLYAYARKGITVPLLNRTCQVYSWDVLDWNRPELGFRLRCSHGTYARSLAVHLGAKLGCAAVLCELRRESVGPYQVSDAIPLNDAMSAAPGTLAARLLRAQSQFAANA